MLRRSIGIITFVLGLAAAAAHAQPPVVRTADPIKRGMQLSDFPRTVKVADNIYTYDNQLFYPVDGLGWNAGASPQTGTDCGGTTGHNFAFTSELHYPFTYLASAPVAKPVSCV